MPKKAQLSIAAIAAHLFLSARRVRQLIDEDVLPEVVFSLDVARRRYIADLRAKAKARTSRGSPLEDARNEALRLDIHRKKLELAELEGDLVRLSVCEEEWAATCIRIRNKLLTAPSKCAAVVPSDVSPVVSEMVKEVVRDVLHEIKNDVGTLQ